MEKYTDKLKDLLMTEPTFTVEDKVNKNYVASLARQYDKKLLELLFSDKGLSEFFFVDVNGSKVFKKDTFLAFINNKEFLPDSYTAFKSKIGLGTDADNYLSEDSRVVLNWPYKDCVLEGGQDKEDQKRDEVFFNEILAPDQINTILDDKVFTNWKRYDKDGEHDLDELKPDDNLIIKGNNLVVLHSLKKRFAGKVKLIYIDPPYNTGKDGFNYNDHFNHSSWLTFMKNRILAAKSLLKSDGIMMIQCDDNEQAYLKVLCDELFNYQVDCIIWQKMDARYDQNTNAKIINRYKEIHEYVLICYNSDKKNILFNKIKKLPEWKNEQSNPDNDKRGKYKQGIISFAEGHKNEDKNSPNYYTITTPSGRKITRQFFIPEDEFDRLVSDNRIYFPNNGDGIPALKVFENEEHEYKMESILRGFGTSSSAKDEILALFGDRDKFSTPKPEKLICELIRATTSEGDIVLDFCAGSGTTSAVAHKMNRQHISIEQMGYIDDTTVERLKKVIMGDRGGVSESVNWTGGGSFVYCNIKNDANTFREKVQHADEKELEGLLDQVLKSSFLSYRVDPKKVSKKEFAKLSLADKKRILVELVNNNTLYLNYSEINDKTYNISDADKKHNKEFYEED